MKYVQIKVRIVTGREYSVEDCDGRFLHNSIWGRYDRSKNTSEVGYCILEVRVEVSVGDDKILNAKTP